MFGKGKSEEIQKDVEIFTVFDSKTNSYELPTFAFNHHDCVRQIINMFKDPSQAKNKFLLNAEDYSLFRIGSYSKRTGLIYTEQLTHIANLHDLRALVAQEQSVIPEVQGQPRLTPDIQASRQ